MIIVLKTFKRKHVFIEKRFLFMKISINNIKKEVTCNTIFEVKKNTFPRLLRVEFSLIIFYL